MNDAWQAPLKLLFIVMALSACILLSTGLGSSFIAPDRVAAAMLGVGEKMDQIIVWKLRLPRILLATLAGAALGLAGALTQRALRNPMADPSILGVSDGAALGVVSFLFFFSNDDNILTASIHWMPFAALIGAGSLSLLVGLCVRLTVRGVSPARLILVGVALAALAKAAVVLLMILGPVHNASQALRWMTGSVYAAHWNDVVIVAAALSLAMPLLWCLRLPLLQICLDPQSAYTTGLKVDSSRVALLSLSVVLTGVAVSQVGTIGFVGLMAPHAARLLLGQFSAIYLPGTAAIGAMLVLFADTTGRTMLPPHDVPAGAVTALLGTPLFLFLLIRSHYVKK